METKFTVAEFNKQVCEFRKMMGDKAFWAKPSVKRQQALDGLSMAYMFIHNDDGSLPSQETIDSCAVMLDATVQEYSRRETMLISIGATIGA